MNSIFFAGSFDPLTLGHLNIIKKAASMTDRLVIGVGGHHGKESLLSVETKLDLITKVVSKIGDHIEVVSFSNLLVDAIREHNCTITIRGIRDTSDLNYELRMYNTNKNMTKHIETIFLPTDNSLNHISSTLVRQIYKMGGKIDNLVPEEINNYLINNYNSITKGK